MDYQFNDEEKLYRAVYPYSMFWKENGKVSSAAFLSKKGGCSVDRGNYRDDEAVVQDMKARNFQGSIISITVKNCRETEAEIVYTPSKNNKYHSEIYKNQEKELLTAKQRKHLANSAVIVKTAIA